MGITYNYLKTAWQKKTDSFPGKLLIYLIVLVLATIPLDFKYNSIAVIVFVAYSLISFKKENLKGGTFLLFPVLLFGLMALSLLWTIDTAASTKALGKELSLLVIPLAFFINPQLVRKDTNTILNYFSLCTIIYGLYYLLRAFFRYMALKDTNVFFYHELAGDNAIYASAFFSIAAFYYVSVARKKWHHYIALLFIIIIILLLSSKTIIIIDFLVISCYFFFAYRNNKRARIISIAGISVLVISLGFFGKIRERIMQEYNTNTKQTYTYITSGGVSGVVREVSMSDAWHTGTFSPADRFSGTSFRVYQAKIFYEMLREDPIFFNGYGLNASQSKIESKGAEHNVFLGNSQDIGYQMMNFHNQYIQAFAELGIAGLLLLLFMVAVNLKNAIKNKYFVHIAFAILMITLFLTESFIWRQRGIVLFTVLYCIFNSIAKEERKII